jgi:hypothetical protein
VFYYGAVFAIVGIIALLLLIPPAHNLQRQGAA